jgi:hypothetical protein
MANPKKAEVEIRLDGEVHVLRYGFNELCELEEELGMAFQDVAQKANARFLRAALWVAMRKKDRRLTLEQVGNKLHGLSLQERTEHMMALVNALMLAYTGQSIDDLSEVDMEGAVDAENPMEDEQTGTS